ncbi:hypothetical protein PAXRUDRAFT_179599, partial [Paxillus rubicundulus Ve08.2h10]
STHQWTINHPDMSQSELHMGLYYVGCQIESAVSHLVHQPDKNWPNNWQPLLDREFVSSHIVTHPTTVVPAPAVKGLYHISHKNFGMLVPGFNV